jgi:aminoglycoside phosphotransferase (APT) family kinase protein
MESELFNALLEYLRTQLNNEDIQFKEKPVKIPEGLGADKYIFTLFNAPEHLTQPLLVRTFRKSYREGYAEGEAKVQNTLHNTGYPVPRVFFACSDKRTLGREFTIMEYKKGINLSKTGSPDIPEILGSLQAELHSINPSTLMKKLTPEDVGSVRYSITEYLDEYIRKNNHSRLFSALEWVLNNRPPLEPVVICHSDFHADNILWGNDSVSAVLDWGAFRFEEPAWGIAYITVKLRSLYHETYLGIPVDDYFYRYFRAYNVQGKFSQDRFTYFKAVGALNALNEIDTQINEITDESLIQLLGMMEDYFVNLFEEISGVKILKLIS